MSGVIVILKPDTPRESRTVKAVTDRAATFPGVTARVHEVAGSTRSLIEIYLIGSTSTIPTTVFEEIEIGRAHV